MNRLTETHRMDWNCMMLEITYEPDWMPSGIADDPLAHITVHSIYPETDAPLPIAPSGWYARAFRASTVASAGGPVNFIDVMLEAEGGAHVPS